MSQDWKDFLARQNADADGESFGNQTAELRAAREKTIFAPLLDQGLIRARGDDAASFLHNLLTNDVANLGVDEVRFAGFCSAKGRLLASFHIWREGDDLLLQMAADLLPGNLKKLSMYILRCKVSLADASSEKVLLGLAGPEAEAVLQSLQAPIPAVMHAAPFQDGSVLCIGPQRYVLSLSPQTAMALWPQLAAKAVPVGVAAWRWLEIAAGQPRVVAATQEAFVPQMMNMEVPAVSGVIFTKGCYPGQEIVARTQYLGKVKRRMYRAHMDDFAPPGTDVFTPEAGDQHCGALATVAPSPDGGYDCLVVVQSSGAEAGEVHVGSLAGPRLAIATLPYGID